MSDKTQKRWEKSALELAKEHGMTIEKTILTLAYEESIALYNRIAVANLYTAA